MKTITIRARVPKKLERQDSGHAFVAEFDGSARGSVAVDGVKVETGLWGGRFVSWDKEEADGHAHDLIRKLAGKSVLITIDILED